MAFNSSGVYTRIDNSFSNPVLGTTISPTHADTYFDDIDAALNAYRGTSTTSLEIATGEKIFTTQTGKLFTEGRFVLIVSDADEDNYMFGSVTTYSSTTLTVDVTAIGGSGTLADWTIYNSGPRGANGATGREAGLNYKWNTSTAAGDPTTGKITISDAGTVLNISETDDDAQSLAAIFATWDDSTTTGNRGKLYMMKTGGAGLKVFTIASAVTDNGTYDSFTGSVITVGSFSNNDEMFCYFIPTGDKGDAGSGLAAVVDDTTPQLGGQLDVNGNAIGDGTLELLKFEETASAINEVTIVNAAVGAGPTIKATGDDTNIDLNLAGKGTGIPKIGSAAIKTAGKETIWIPARAMTPRTTNGARPGLVEMATNKNMFLTLDFSTSTQEFAQFEVFFPKSWNLGTVTFQPIVSHASGSGNVVFGLAGVARSDDDAGDVAFGTPQTSDKTVGTANDIYIGPESSAITIAGTPADGDTVQFEINRTVASDSLGVDARLHGIRFSFTSSTATDV